MEERERRDIRGIAEECCTSMISVDDLERVLRLVQGTWSQRVPGCILEMGCHAGGTSLAIARLLSALPYERPALHVCDSFRGFPTPAAVDGARWQAGDLAAPKAELLARFARCPWAALPAIHEGFFAEIRDYPEQVAFAFVDGDLYESTLDAIAVVWPRLSVGGRVAFHDHNGSMFPGVRAAVAAALPGVYVDPWGGLGVALKANTAHLARRQPPPECAGSEGKP